MSSMLVTQQNIAEVAKQCRGRVGITDADMTRRGLYIQVDAQETRYDRDARAYIGDMIETTNDGFRILKSSEIANAA